MPTDTFYRLPEEKRQKLIRAIREELSRVPFSELSVNRIVQSAGVARGSYYQYFTGKDDLLRFALSSYFLALEAFLDDAFTACRGDAFAVILSVFDRAAACGLAPENRALYANLFLNLQDPVFLETCAAESQSLLHAFCARADRRLLAVDTEEDCLLAADLLLSAARCAIAALFTQPENAAAIRDRLSKTLTLMKNGLARREVPAHAC